MSDVDIDAELAAYPRTGRFLAGRLRYDLSGEEKRRLEGRTSRIMGKGENLEEQLIVQLRNLGYSNQKTQ